MDALSGKTALVTGAASGIGEGMAVKLAETGANLAICDLQETVHDVAEKIANDTGVTVHADVVCLLYTSPSPRDRTRSRMPSSA